jgi:hypothetical protein
MTVEHVCCVALGVAIEAMTFIFGIMIGASLRRKEPSDETKQFTRACSSHSTR